MEIRNRTFLTIQFSNSKFVWVNPNFIPRTIRTVRYVRTVRGVRKMKFFWLSLMPSIEKTFEINAF